jgi:hypothetical protein
MTNRLQRYLTGTNHKVLIGTPSMLQRYGFVQGPLTSAGTNDENVIVEYGLTRIGREIALRGEIKRSAEKCEFQLVHARAEFERGQVWGCTPSALR